MGGRDRNLQGTLKADDAPMMLQVGGPDVVAISQTLAPFGVPGRY